MKIPHAPVVELRIGGKDRKFDLDDPKLPAWVSDGAINSDDYPYGDRMKRSRYEDELAALQRELVKVLYWLADRGERVIIVFEGRDAAGKGGTIGRLRQNMNPRQVRAVALPKPSDVERGQWYFQRYVDHFPTAGECVLFDRSWYNRAGVEPVMGFCTPDQHEKFLDDVPKFERMITDEGIHLFKFWLNIGQEMQLLRFHARRHNPLKVWKLSPIDLKALDKWDEYTHARDRMLAKTHSRHAPWIVVKSNDKRRARLAVISRVLSALNYTGRDDGVIGKPDKKLIGEGPQFLDIATS